MGKRTQKYSKCKYASMTKSDSGNVSSKLTMHRHVSWTRALLIAWMAMKLNQTFVGMVFINERLLHSVSGLWDYWQTPNFQPQKYRFHSTRRETCLDILFYLLVTLLMKLCSFRSYFGMGFAFPVRMPSFSWTYFWGRVKRK